MISKHLQRKHEAANAYGWAQHLGAINDARAIIRYGNVSIEIQNVADLCKELNWRIYPKNVNVAELNLMEFSWYKV